MKNKNTIIISLVILSVIIFSFINKPAETPKYEYMKISQQGKAILISTSAGYSERKVESGNFLDASGLMKVIEEYQNAGWEVISGYDTSGNGYVHNCLLRKQK
jgi:hypothetical protein